MKIAATTPKRRPRFHRATEPRPFRITDGDLEIVRLLGRHRFLRSTQIAKLVDRSLDRTNERLSLLYHAGYVDRPRAQLDRFPTGSGHMVYALATRGARLLQEYDGAELRRADLSEQNQSSSRPFIEHQLEIMEFYVALQSAIKNRCDVTLIHPHEIIAAFPERTRATRNPLKLNTKLSIKGTIQEIGLVPDMVFGLRFADGSRRCFMVEVDRATMPVARSDHSQTSFAEKMRGYLAIHATGQHEQRYGWKAFRVLTITTSRQRVQAMIDALRAIPQPGGPGASLFFFTERDKIAMGNPLLDVWLSGSGRSLTLI